MCGRKSSTGLHHSSRQAGALRAPYGLPLPAATKPSALLVVLLTTSVVTAGRTELVHDTLVLAPDDPHRPDMVQVVFTNASRLVVDPAGELRHASILNAPRLREIEGTPELQILIVGSCALARLEDTLARLSGATILKVEHCRLNGTLDLAALYATPALVTFSVEGNRFGSVVRSHDPTEPPALEVLELSGNALEHFDWSVLAPFARLRELQLGRNRLLSLAGEVRLPDLSVLSLPQNRLVHADLTGCDCAALEQVHFSVNAMTSWPTFAASSTAVRALDLTRNHLSVINYTELAKHRSLDSLQLSRNAIGSLEPQGDEFGDNETVLELPSLQSLFLDENQLEGLQLDRWQLPTLRMLSVKFNPLRSLPAQLFERWPTLYHFLCYCPAIECRWVEEQSSFMGQRIVQMMTSLSHKPTDDPAEHCVPVPKVGCVLCTA